MANVSSNYSSIRKCVVVRQRAISRNCANNHSFPRGKSCTKNGLSANKLTELKASIVVGFLLLLLPLNFESIIDFCCTFVINVGASVGSCLIYSQV